MRTRTKTTNMVLSAALLAIGMVLPFLTGQIQVIGNKISPMHLPVLICGYVCGWQYGLAVGIILPILRSLTFGMPPLMPTAAAMAVEMGVYGLMTGLLYATLPKKNSSIYISLIAAMILGRLAWGMASVVLYGLAGTGKVFTLPMFFTGAVINAVPALIIQIILIPAIVIALKKAKLMD
ncbi:MAG: ECF transporter S component [Lachnospiraceae bacterium]|nr:ECF transporter S component [Lachnospiraceae bacterium]